MIFSRYGIQSKNCKIYLENSIILYHVIFGILSKLCALVSLRKCCNIICICSLKNMHIQNSKRSSKCQWNFFVFIKAFSASLRFCLKKRFSGTKKTSDYTKITHAPTFGYKKKL